jgi:hypothetical protein
VEETLVPGSVESEGFLGRAIFHMQRPQDQGMPYSAFSPMEDDIFKKHRPTDDLGSPCEEYGEGWPCEMFKPLARYQD